MTIGCASDKGRLKSSLRPGSFVDPRLRARLPGLALLGSVAIAGHALGTWTPVPAVAWAILGGVLAGRAAWAVEGAKTASRGILFIAIALLGTTIAWSQAVDHGPAALGTAALVLAAVFSVMAFASGRHWSIAIGTAICGASAIAAMRSQTKASDQEVAAAVAIITFLGTAGLILIPLLAWILPFDAQQMGALAGASLHAVPQALAAGYTVGGEAGGSTAALVKMSRVAMLPAIALLWSAGRRAPVPKEVLAFLSILVLSFWMPEAMRAYLAAVDRWLFLIAFAGMGAMIRPREVAWGRQGLMALAMWTVAIAAGALAALLWW